MLASEAVAIAPIKPLRLNISNLLARSIRLRFSLSFDPVFSLYSVNKVFQRIDSPQRSPQERGGKAAYSLLCVPAATSAVEPKIDNFVNTIVSTALTMLFGICLNQNM
jgi:hypothetical protein